MEPTSSKQFPDIRPWYGIQTHVSEVTKNVSHARIGNLLEASGQEKEDVDNYFHEVVSCLPNSRSAPVFL